LNFGSTNRTQILIGVIALFAGSLVYLVDRGPDSTYFVYSISNRISLHNIVPSLFGPIGQNLPSFIHVLSFSLITAGLLSCKSKGCLIVCVAWLFSDCVFELGQKFNEWFLKIIPDFSSGIPILENVKSFFLLGVFDVYDLVAMVIGAMTAYAVLLVTSERRILS
jgi:hypothetical protein